MAGQSREQLVIERARREVEARRAVGRRRPGPGWSWLATHWLGVVNGANALVVLGVVVAPWLRSRGAEEPARLLYGFFRLQCPQRPDHSFFLFGEQLAMEQRMVAIYAGWLLAGLAFALIGGRVRSLSPGLALGLTVPMAIDIGSQMVGWRDSSWAWRTATGGVFALASAWWVLPLLAAAMRHLGTGGRTATASAQRRGYV